MNLQMKIQMPIILLVILISGASGYLSYTESAENLNLALIDNMRGEAESLVRAINTTTDSTVADIRRIAERSGVRDFFTGDISDKNTVAATSAMLKAVADSYPAINRLSLLDTKGSVVASSDMGTIGRDFSGRGYFKAVMGGARDFLSSPYKSDVSGRGVMAASAPVMVDGVLKGVVYGIIALDHFYKEWVEPVKVGEHGHAFLLGQDGLIVAHRNPDWPFNPSLRSVPRYKEMVEAPAPGVKDFIGNTGVHVFNYYAKDKDSGMTAVVQAEYDDVFAGLADMRNKALLVATVAIVVGGLLVFLLLRPVLRALNDSMAFAGRVAAGDLSGNLAVSRRDELGKLADALRAIPMSLKDIIAEYQGLEKRIEGGQLDALGDAGRFSGEFAALVQGTNGILKRFRMIVDTIPSPTVMLDKDLRIRYMNDVARELAATEYVGRTCGEVFHREDYGTPADALTRAASSGKPCSAETRAHPAGKTIDISYTSIPMQNARGETVAVLQLLIDLTEIKSTQRTIMEVVKEALGISNRVAAASEELSAQVEQVSRGTDVQRDRVGSTATAMEQMNSTVMEVARSAGQASEQAEATRGRAARGAELVDGVITAIKQVNSVAADLENNMQELGRQAEAIGGVMNVISDIADQTNLLALNAAIEAARAGEAGRGFAVVADEVRKLAEKTMSATTEVGSSIRGIQASTASNIQRVGEAGKGVSDATALAGTSGEALHEIVTLAAQNSAVIAGIATAAEEQSATSEEISRAIEEINRIAGETASGMGQSGTAVQELSRMAQELKGLLDRLQR